MSKSRNIFLLFLLFLLLLGCEKKIKRVDSEQFAFGTFFKISVFGFDEKTSKNQIEDAFKEIERIDSKFNSKVKGSLVDNLNNLKTEKFDDEGLYLLNEVKEAYNLSNHKYDITMEPLMNVWGFSEEIEPRTTLPSKEELNEAMSNVDFSKIRIEGNKVFIDKEEIKIDTGSFLKGYAVKKAGEKLRAAGVKNGFISAISSIEAIGTKGDGKSWKIGIQNPNNPSEILGIVELNNQSMGVSGDYQTYVEINGKKYHHIIDKETGYPVNDKKMVVVVNNDSLEADLYSTTFFLMPIEKVLKQANETEGLDVLIVDKNDKIYTSKNLKFKKNN
ncbi:FAD:protein FMN transferase [Candidatus Cetobacterium colombiensis]|uniref:FAD:protein FMN transferase n=1 Tax=Candidatus Cetobacterium colombiensis TaxID=3073100 RepID=A0ABU4WCE9_9FUSO|nr:FAD:protein FMN transferase [Candidatus Cetobacterium colombiensis]MDX8337186.1 FAD:protein FMN transferase [Candidatus Cetobacterium colombiensis]